MTLGNTPGKGLFRERIRSQPPRQERVKVGRSKRYRTYCLEEQERERTDVRTLEYLVWRMTSQRHADRLHDIDKMLLMLEGVVSF